MSNALVMVNPLWMLIIRMQLRMKDYSMQIEGVEEMQAVDFSNFLSAALHQGRSWDVVVIPCCIGSYEGAHQPVGAEQFAGQLEPCLAPNGRVVVIDRGIPGQGGCWSAEKTATVKSAGIEIIICPVEEARELNFRL